MVTISFSINKQFTLITMSYYGYLSPGTSNDVAVAEGFEAVGSLVATGYTPTIKYTIILFIAHL